MNHSASGRLATLLRRTALALVAVIAVLALLLALAGDRIYPKLLEVAGRLGAGVAVSASGPVSVEFWPELSVTASGLGIAPIAAPGWQADLGDVSVRISGASLLRGQLALTALTIKGGHVRVDRGEGGGPGPGGVLGALQEVHADIANLDITLDGGTAAAGHVIHIERMATTPAAGGQPEITATGSIDGHALSIDARVGTRTESVDGVMAYPLQGSFQVADWNLEATLTGHVEQPTAGAGLRLEGSVKVGDVAPLARLLGTPWPTAGRLEGTASITGDVAAPRLARVAATLDDDGVQSSIDGTGIALASREFEKLTLRYKGVLPAGLVDGDPLQHLDTAVSLAGKPGAYTLTIDNLRAAMPGDASVEAKGTLQLATLNGSALGSASYEKLDLHYKGPLPAGTIDGDPVKDIDAVVSLAGNPGAYTLTIHSLRAAMPGDASVEANGTLQLATLSGSALGSASYEKLDLHYKGPLPAGTIDGDPMKDIDAVASLAGKPGDYRLTVDSLRASLPGKTTVEAKGELTLATLGDWAAARSQLDLKADTADLKALSKLAGQSLPDIGAVRASAKLTGTLASAKLGDLRVQAGGNGKPRLTANGRVGLSHLLTKDAPSTGHLDTDLQIELAPTDAKLLGKLIGVELQPPGLWSANGHLLLSEKGWRLESMSIQAGSDDGTRIEIAGEASGRGALRAGVERIAAGTAEPHDAADLYLVLSTQSVGDTARLLGWAVPSLGGLKTQGRLLVSDGNFALEDFELRSLGKLRLAGSGRIGTLHGFDDVTLEMKLEPADPRTVDRVLDLALPLTGPIAFDLAVARQASQPMTISGEARIGSSSVTVDLTGETGGTRPLVKGTLHSAVMDARDFWSPTPDPVAAKAPEATSPTPPARSESLGLLGVLPGLGFLLQGTLEHEEAAQPAAEEALPADVPQALPEDVPDALPDDVLPWRRLQQVDIDIDLRFEQMRGRSVEAGPLEMRLVDKDGILEFGPVKLSFKGGSLELHGRADSSVEPPTVVVEGHGRNLPLAALIGRGDAQTPDITGDLSFQYKLESKGLTMVALRESLSGDIRAVIENGVMPLNDLQLASGNLTKWVLTWAEKSNRTPVPCALALFEIKAGIATAKTLLLETPDTAVYGKGTIDLREDTLDLQASPRRRGLSLGGALTIHVTGPLSAPIVETQNTGGVFLHYGGALATTAIFPASSLFNPVLDLIGSDGSSPCL